MPLALFGPSAAGVIPPQAAPALSDEEMFGAPVAPPPQAHTLAPAAGLSDEEMFGGAPAATSHIGQVFAPPAAVPAPAPVSLADRFGANFNEGAKNTVQGGLANLFDAATQDQVEKTLRAQGFGENADAYRKARIAGDAATAAKYANMPAFNAQGGFIDKALAGAAALSGQVAGSLTSPESFVTLPERGLAALERLAAPVVGKVVPKVLAPAATRLAARGAEQAVINTATDPAVQGLNIAAGKQQGYDPVQTALAAPLGFAIGGAVHAPTEGLAGVADAFRAWRAGKGDGAAATQPKGGKPAPEAPPTPQEVEDFAASPELAAFYRANGITDPKDPRIVQLEDRLAARRHVESVTVTAPRQTAEGAGTQAFHADQARLAGEREGIENGDIHPGFNSQAGRAPRAPLPEQIPVTPEGQADVGDLGVRAGMDKFAARDAGLPVPTEPQPNRMTDAEITRSRAKMAGGNQNTAAPPERLITPEDRLPQTPDQVQGQRQAGEAFRQADNQKANAGSFDTQPGGRPEGVDAEQVVLDDGFPVRVLNRTVKDVGGKHVEMAQVHRYDPRTGQLDPEAMPYEVPVRQLKNGNYAQAPRQAQDFVRRAESPRDPEQPRMPAEGIRQERSQTYRTTDRDPNEDFPGATRPGPGDGEGSQGRSPLPEQPDGPHPGPQRPRNEDEAIRDFQARARDREGADYRARRAEGARKEDAKASSVAASLDGEKRFPVDDRGYVASDKGGPMRFADQKQAAKWIINEGHKKSADQIFEIENHPSGKGFTVHERGRADTKPPEPPKNSSLVKAEPPRDASGRTSSHGPESGAEGARAPVGETQARAASPEDRDIGERQKEIHDSFDGLDKSDQEKLRAEGYDREEGGPDKGPEESGRDEANAGTPRDNPGRKENAGGNDRETNGVEQRDHEKPNAEGGIETGDGDGAQETAVKGVRNKFYSNPVGDPETWRDLGHTLSSAFGWARNEADAWTHHLENMLSSLPKVKAEGGDPFTRAWRATYPMRRWVEILSYSNDGRLRSMAARFKSDAVKDLANRFFAAPRGGREGAIGKDYFQAINEKRGQMLNRLEKTLIGFKDKNIAEVDAAMNQVGRLIQNPGAIKPGTPVHDAAAEIGALLKDALEYMRKAGVDVGEVKRGYLPRIENINNVMADPSKFKAAAKRAFMADGVPSKDAAAGAEDWFNRIALGDLGIHHDGNDFVSMPGGNSSSFTKGRTLSKKADEIMGDFYLRNPADILPAYINRAVQKAEWSRRMGPRNKDTKPPRGVDEKEWREDPNGKWTDIKNRMIDEGNGAHVPDVVRIIKSMTGNMGGKWSVAGSGRAAINFARTWSALTYLPKAVFASLSEPVNISLRTGNTLDAGRAYMRTLQHWIPIVRNAAGPKYLREMAHDLGIIGEGVDNITMLQRVGNDDGSNLSRKLQTLFFRRTGLTQLTEANRMAAVHIGMTFIRRLASDVANKSHYETISRRMLGELGIGADKIKGSNGDPVESFANWVMSQDKPSGKDILNGGVHGDLYNSALGRFVSQTVMAPSGATRTYFAQHPLGGLIYNLQSFNYAFQKNVLNRITAMTKDAVNPKSGLNAHERAYALMPLVNLVPLLMVSYGVGEIRDALFKDPAREGRPDMTFDDKAKRAISRAGITGSLDMPYNAVTGARYQRDPLTAMLGPVVGGGDTLVGDALDAGSERNSPNTNTFERKAAKDVYQMVIQPTLEAGALALAPERTAVGFGLGAAAIYGASHPATREKAVRAVAGAPVLP